MHSGIERPKLVIAAVITTVIMFAAGVISIAITTENAVAQKYENNQATSTSNSCLNPLFDSNTVDVAADIGNCGATVSQQQGSGHSSAPITNQITRSLIEVQTPPPTESLEPQTCEECFTAFLTAEQLAAFEVALSDQLDVTIEELCNLLESGGSQVPILLDEIAVILEQSGVDQPTIDEIIDCLERVLSLA